MVKIDELRRALRNGTQEDALSEHPDAPRALRRYKPSADGSDALLQFGRHKGLTLKQVQKSDPVYLFQLLHTDIDKELKELIRDVQRQVKIERDAADLDAASAALIENAGKIGAEMGKKVRSDAARAVFEARKAKIPDSELKALFQDDPELERRHAAARKRKK